MRILPIMCLMSIYMNVNSEKTNNSLLLELNNNTTDVFEYVNFYGYNKNTSWIINNETFVQNSTFAMNIWNTRKTDILGTINFNVLGSNKSMQFDILDKVQAESGTYVFNIPNINMYYKSTIKYLFKNTIIAPWALTFIGATITINNK